jgi:diguanylate cyclase (GGDEF)-like protein
MLTYAIGFVLDVQLTCFAIILACMALQDRANRSLRWLAYGYCAGLGGAILDWGGHWFAIPHFLSRGLFMEAPILGYGCFCVSISLFVRRGRRGRWFPAFCIVAALPFFLVWALSGHLDRSATLQDFMLALETALTVALLLLTVDHDTRWPRRVMAAFLGVYSAVEFARVAIFLVTGHMPERAAPWIEDASGIVYIVSAAALPLAFIWMMNARLLVHLSRLSMIDPLTELLNRRGLEAAVDNELARYARSGDDFAVVVLDLDHFKALNDQFGHAAGDSVLCGFSVFLRNMVREVDIVGRFGGEEFVLFLPGAAPDDAFAIIERLRIALSERIFPIGSKHARITASFGITVSAGRAAIAWETLQHEADLALYAAKRAGRNVSRFYSRALADAPPPVVSASIPPSSEPAAPFPPALQ